MLTPEHRLLKNPPYDAVPGTSRATWLSGPDGVVTNPAEPALPLVPSTSPPPTATWSCAASASAAAPTRHRDDRPAHRRPDDRAARRPRAVRLTGLLPDAPVEPELLRRPRRARRHEPPRHARPAQATTRRSGRASGAVHGPQPAALLQRQPDQAALSDAPTIVGVQTEPSSGSQLHGPGRRRSQGRHPRGLDHLHRRHRDMGAARPDPGRDRLGLWTGTLPVGAGRTSTSSSRPSTASALSPSTTTVGLLRAAAAPVVPPRFARLISPPTSGTFGQSPAITAELKSGGTPLASKPIVIASVARRRRRDRRNGRATVRVPLSTSRRADPDPGLVRLRRDLRGIERFARTVHDHQGDREPVAVHPSRPGRRPRHRRPDDAERGVAARRRWHYHEPAHPADGDFTLTGPVNKTVSTITDFLGQAKLPKGLPAGTYNVTASFAGDARTRALPGRALRHRAVHRVLLAGRQPARHSIPPRGRASRSSSALAATAGSRSSRRLPGA